MSSLPNKRSHPPEPRYREVVATVERHIARLPPGRPVPSTTWWRGKLGVSRTTITRAFAELKAKGLLTTRVGAGTVTALRARTKTVLVLWNRNARRSHTQFGGEFLAGASRACEGRGDLLVAHVPAEDYDGTWNPGHLFPGLCGVLFFRAPELAAKLAPALEAQNIPWLLYGSSAYAYGSHGLAVDEAHVVSLILDELARLGHHRIGMLFRGGHKPGQARFEAWKEWHWKVKRPIDPGLAVDSSLVLNPQHAPALRAWIDGLGAVLCATDGEAVALMEAARPLGISIPENLSIIGVDNQPLGDLLRPPLSSVEIPVETHGQFALECLLSGKAPGLLRDATLILRGSAAKAKGQPLP